MKHSFSCLIVYFQTLRSGSKKPATAEFFFNRLQGVWIPDTFKPFLILGEAKVSKILCLSRSGIQITVTEVTSFVFLHELLMSFRNKCQQLDSKTFCFSFTRFKGVVNRQTDGYTEKKNLKMTAYIQRLLHVVSQYEHYLITVTYLTNTKGLHPKCLCSLFQTDAVCPAVHMNTTSHIHASETNCYEMLCTRSGFEREATSNLEMAHFPLLVKREIQSKLTVWKT